MVIAQGQLKRLAYKKQSALGTPAAGSGGQYLRRETATFNKAKATFNANEIVTHQQYTGDTYGVGSASGSINNVLSPDTYADFLQSLLRRDVAAVTAISALSLTIAAGSGTSWTLTRASGSFLTDGVKVGHVVRITAGTYTGTARDINLVVTAVTALALTVLVGNGSSLSAQGPVATSTLTIMGKTTYVPTTGHTNDYYSFEEWQSDLSKSRLYSDMQVASADISIPATGNSTVALSLVGLNRTKGTSQVLTSPSAETTTPILSASNAVIMVGGNKTLVATSLSIKIDGQTANGEAVIGSKSIADNVRGAVKVNGTVTVLYDSETMSDYFENETPVPIVAAIFNDNSATSDFVSFVIPYAKLMKDDIDDGMKQLTMTCDFSAQICPASLGGAGLAYDQTIIGMQDSLA